MLRKMLLAKIHRVTVTHSLLDYEGSCAIDKTLLNAAGLVAYEAIDIYNVTNGERFSTYIIEAPEDSGVISVNGAAAHKAKAGDIIIIAAYGLLTKDEVAVHKPRLVYVTVGNQIKSS